MKTRITLSLLLIVLLATNVFSQLKVTGKIVDNKQEPLGFANVVIQAADTLFGTFSNESGIFELQVIPQNYTLKISMLGYNSYEI